MTATEIIACLRVMANYYAPGSVGRNTCEAAADLMTASGMEARRVETEGLDAKHDSPSDAQKETE